MIKQQQHTSYQLLRAVSELRATSSLCCILPPTEQSTKQLPTCKLFGDTFEKFLYCSSVANKRGAHFKSPWCNITHGCLYIVRNPFNEVRRVFILHLHHLFINFLQRYFSPVCKTRVSFLFQSLLLMTMTTNPLLTVHFHKHTAEKLAFLFHKFSPFKFG